MRKVWKPESDDDSKLCTHYKLTGPKAGDNAWCVHLKDHDGVHHWEGDLKE